MKEFTRRLMEIVDGKCECLLIDELKLIAESPETEHNDLRARYQQHIANSDCDCKDFYEAIRGSCSDKNA